MAGKPSPSKRGDDRAKEHLDAATLRAIARAARGRRIVAARDKKEGTDKK